MRSRKKKKLFSKTLYLVFLIFLLSTLVTSLSILKNKRNSDLEYRQKLLAEENSNKSNYTSKTSRGDKNISNYINTNNSDKFIVLDPGHGGYDCGTVSSDNKIQEKDLTLEISKKVRDYLEAKNYTVLLTRTMDKAMDGATTEKEDLHIRSSLINSSNAAILVSIHINFSEEPSCTGVFNYIPNNDSAFNNKNVALSKSILKSIEDSSNWSTSGTTPQNIFILNNATMPSVLVECGFISNPGDLKKLQNPDEKDALAKSIVKGIINYTENE